MGFSTRTMEEEDWDELHFFTKDEFKFPKNMGYEFMVWLEKVRVEARVPMPISSSYRSVQYNLQIGGANKSAHTLIPCNCVDIPDPGNEGRYRIIRAAMKYGCKRIGSYSDGSIHLDRAESSHPAPRMWRVVK